jgi:hypothetical protein
MDSKKYLYTSGSFGNKLNRYVVTRETESNIWIRINDNYEEKIPKKTYRTGSGWNHTYYMIETDDLKNQYASQRVRYKYLKYLELLKSCNNDLFINNFIKFIDNENILSSLGEKNNG